MQPVLLIDEIDKADIEFPNDLLRELDRMEFYVYETKETVVAKHRPIIVITSNNEKELPDAFLRRCFFHYIRFPDADTMKDIVDVHYPGLKKELAQRGAQSLLRFARNSGPEEKSHPPPSCWTGSSCCWPRTFPPEALSSDDRRKTLPPLYGALLKNEQDVHMFEKMIFLNHQRDARKLSGRYHAFFFLLLREGA